VARHPIRDVLGQRCGLVLGDDRRDVDDEVAPRPEQRRDHAEDGLDLIEVRRVTAIERPVAGQRVLGVPAARHVGRRREAQIDRLAHESRQLARIAHDHLRRTADPSPDAVRTFWQQLHGDGTPPHPDRNGRRRAGSSERIEHHVARGGERGDHALREAHWEVDILGYTGRTLVSELATPERDPRLHRPRVVVPTETGPPVRHRGRRVIDASRTSLGTDKRPRLVRGRPGFARPPVR
jgi:hypothetical protein